MTGEWRWIFALLASVATPACDEAGEGQADDPRLVDGGQDDPDDPDDDPDEGDDPGGETPTDVAEPGRCETDCANLAPTGTPEGNRTEIQWCLNHCSVTSLRAGALFRLRQSIVVPSGKTLTTAGATGTLANNNWAELRETADPNRTPVAFASNRLVTVCSRAPETGGCASGSPAIGGTLRRLTLNVDNKSNETVPNAVINVEGRGNLIEHVVVTNPVLHSSTPIAECSLQSSWGPVNRFTAIAFNPPDRDNIMRKSRIYGVRTGVVFGDGLGPSSNNVIDDVEITMVRSNPVTFAGYGKVINSHIHHNGWCVGDGLDGGAIYCADNPNGGVLRDNRIHDTCRDVIDYDNCAHMVIQGNHLYNPGTRTYPAPVGYVGTKCNSAQTMRTGSPRWDVIVDNVVENLGRPWNTVANHFGRDQRFSANGAPAYSDLPQGSRQSMAYLLTRRREDNTVAIGNRIEGNRFVANCNTSSCVGMGFFVTRGTGVDAAGGWSGDTTNTFRENRVTGSPTGSKRCGANWYAGGTATCAPGSTANSCNSDDAQHQGTNHGVVHGNYRNCACRDF